MEDERQDLFDNIEGAKETLEELQEQVAENDALTGGDIEHPGYEVNIRGDLGEAESDLASCERELADWESDNGDEYEILKDITSQLDDVYGAKDGEAMIHEDHWVDYAQELAEDIGAIDDNAKWPCTCIDWEKAAEELEQDYTTVDFDGHTYYIRSC